MGQPWMLVLIILTISCSVSSYCPPVHNVRIERCSLKIKCLNTISDVVLPKECQGSTNFPVSVDVSVINAEESFYSDKLDVDLRNQITSLSISADWRETSLNLLENMHGLEIFHLSNNKIERINGQPFYYLQDLKHIDISHNLLIDITGLFRFREGKNSLKALSLAFNDLTEIPTEAFKELDSLVELNLSHNMLGNITTEAFAYLNSLETLWLNNNEIIDLDGAINKLINLKHLYLKGNHLQTIDDKSIDVIQHLEILDVSENDLETLDSTVLLRHWLHLAGPKRNEINCKIILSGNHINLVPNATFEVMEMKRRFTHPHMRLKHRVATELDLSNNEISVVEYDGFRAIYHLMNLDLSSNKLQDFIINPADLASVKFLNLSSNEIKVLNFNSFSSMTNLKNFDMSHNQLEIIPSHTFTKNHNLKYVNMTNNSLRSLTYLSITFFHPDGGVLDLSHNDLSSLQIPIGEAARLSFLILDYNNITDTGLVDIKHLTDLTDLTISNNQIKYVDKESLNFPGSLVRLDLSQNEIFDIAPSSFYLTPKLETLRLSNNDLTTITYGMFHGLERLRNLDLSSNGIRYLDSKVLGDLKHLQVLSLSYNEMQQLDYKQWFMHTSDLQVNLDGNNFTCDWLRTALSDYEHRFSKMRPVVFTKVSDGRALSGISCDVESHLKENYAISGLTDERLLVISQKILEAVKEQTLFMRQFFGNAIKYQHQNQETLKKITSNEIEL